MKKKNSNKGLAIFCVILILIIAAGGTLGGLEIFAPEGKNMKPSEWFKKDDLAPVTITLTEEEISPVAYVEDAQSMATGIGFPSTKTATATCPTLRGQETYQWQISGGEGLEMHAVDADNEKKDKMNITATEWFPGRAILYARAYVDGVLRGEGSISLTCDEAYVPQDDREFNLAFIQLEGNIIGNDYYTADREECLAELKDHFTNVTTNFYNITNYTSEPIIDTYRTAIEDFGAEIVVIFDHFGKIMQGLENYENEYPDIHPIIIDYVKACPDIAAAMDGLYLVGSIDVVEATIEGDLTEIEANLGDMLNAALAQGQDVTDYYPIDMQEFLQNRGWNVEEYTYTGDPANDRQYANDFISQHPDTKAFFVPSSNELPALIGALDELGIQTDDIWFMVFDMRDDTYAAQYNIIPFHYRLNISGICKALRAVLDGEDLSGGEYYGYVYEKA